MPGGARIVGVAGSGKSKSVAVPALAGGAVLLSSCDVDTLRSVMAELDTCRMLLSPGNGSERHYEHAAKR
jgi:hypothetical protein